MIEKRSEYFLSEYYLLLLEAGNPIWDGLKPFLLRTGSQHWVHIRIIRGAFTNPAAQKHWKKEKKRSTLPAVVRCPWCHIWSSHGPCQAHWFQLATCLHYALLLCLDYALLFPLECFDHFCQLITPTHLASCVKLALALLNASFSGPFLQHLALFWEVNSNLGPMW